MLKVLYNVMEMNRAGHILSTEKSVIRRSVDQRIKTYISSKKCILMIQCLFLGVVTSVLTVIYCIVHLSLKHGKVQVGGLGRALERPFIQSDLGTKGAELRGPLG